MQQQIFSWTITPETYRDRVFKVPDFKIADEKIFNPFLCTLLRRNPSR